MKVITLYIDSFDSSIYLLDFLKILTYAVLVGILMILFQKSTPEEDDSSLIIYVNCCVSQYI